VRLLLGLVSGLTEPLGEQAVTQTAVAHCERLFTQLGEHGPDEVICHGGFLFVSPRKALAPLSVISYLRAPAVLPITLAQAGGPGCARAANSPELKRYPYLTNLVGTSATVNWATTRLYIIGALYGSRPAAI
jgi:hypothetical protein